MATFVDPGQDDQLRDAIERQLQQPMDEALREKRKEWASRFDWLDSAIVLKDVLRGAGRGHDA